jgi:hypothetical protein
LEATPSGAVIFLLSCAFKLVVDIVAFALSLRVATLSVIVWSKLPPETIEPL